MSGNLLEQIDMLEKVGDLRLKSYKPTEIARALEISAREAKHYIQQHEELVRRRVESDPEFLDRVAENTIEALERLDNLVKEAWETYDTAKRNDMIPQQINLLKVAGALEAQRANLLQLMGARMDGGALARMQKAERVNEIVSSIIKEVVSQCNHCKTEVMPRLAEAFAIMNKHEEAADMRPAEEDVIEAEIVEEEEDDHDQNAMMANVISDE